MVAMAPTPLCCMAMDSGGGPGMVWGVVEGSWTVPTKSAVWLRVAGDGGGWGVLR